MNLTKLGETGLISRLSKSLRCRKSVIKGIGDDTAVIALNKNKVLLFASDMLIESTHFDLRKDKPFHIGKKALNVNISDIAAMNGKPKYAVVSLGLPKKLKVRFIDEIYRGLKSAARGFNIDIVGGDTNASSKLIIDIAIMGFAGRDDIVYRSGAEKRDLIMVTGELGGSINGKHLDFTPRIREAQFLSRNIKISSMIDISDGLSQDILRICTASKKGARIYESLIPVSKGSSTKNALNDGEDFELLFTVPRKGSKDLIKRFNKRFKTRVSIIGEITDKAKEIKIIDRYGRMRRLKPSGFKHF